MVAINKTVQMPVMIPPMGKIRMFNPGTTKGAPEATTRVCKGGATCAFVPVTCAAKAPDTNVASSEERVVFTICPVGSWPVNVTVGTRTFWSAALNKSAWNKGNRGTFYLRSHGSCHQVRVDLSNKGI